MITDNGEQFPLVTERSMSEIKCSFTSAPIMKTNTHVSFAIAT